MSEIVKKNISLGTVVCKGVMSDMKKCKCFGMKSQVYRVN